MSSRNIRTKRPSELVNPMKNPSFPFAMYTAGFSVLLLWELWKLSNEEIPYVLAVPLCIMCFGGKGQTFQENCISSHPYFLQ